MNKGDFNSWVTCPSPNIHAALRMFTFPFAGGGTSIFRQWPARLPPDVELCPVQLPGRENRIREKAYKRIDQLVKVLLPSIAVYLNKPFIFFGHSLGALICYELARLLESKDGPRPLQIVVSGCRAPHLPVSSIISDLPKNEFIQALHRYNGSPKELFQYSDLLEMYIPLLRADFAMDETYICSPPHPLSCPIYAFGGLSDCEVNKSDIEEWKKYTHHEFKIKMLDGDHFFIRKNQKQFLQFLSIELKNYTGELQN